MDCDYTGPNYSPEDLRSVIDAMCKSLESSGQIDEHEHPSAYSTLLDTAKWMAKLEGQEPIKKAERDTLAAKLKDAEHDRDEFRRVMNGFAEKMAELEGQEPVAWVEVVSTHEGPYNFEGMALLGKGNHLLYARPVPAESVNARLLTALKACRHQFAHYVAHHISKGDMHKAGTNDAMVAMADVAIMAAEAAPRVARLTMGECMQAVKHISFEEMTLFGIARAIEVAVLRKNGIEVAE